MFENIKLFLNTNHYAKYYLKNIQYIYKMSNNKLTQIYNLIKPKKLIVLDTETTKTGEVIQLAYNIYLYYPEINHFVCVDKYDWIINEKINKIDYYGKCTLHHIIKNGFDPHYGHPAFLCYFIFLWCSTNKSGKSFVSLLLPNTP